MFYVMLDIETIPCMEVPAAPTEREGLPAPPHHQVCSVAMLGLNQDLMPLKLDVTTSRHEFAVLERVAPVIDAAKNTIVTWNGRGFDCPVLYHRMLMHGIPWPRWFNDAAFRTRYKAQGHIDLMDEMCDHGAGMRTSLDAASRLVGLGGKVDDGDEVADMMNTDPERCAKYNACDVALLAGVFMRHCFMSKRQLRPPFEKLVEMIDTEEALEPMRTRIDVERFTMTWPVRSGRELLMRRSMAGLSREEVAAEVGLDVAALEEMENGASISLAVELTSVIQKNL